MFQIVLSQSVREYKDMIETFKLKEFEKECVITLPEGFAYLTVILIFFLFLFAVRCDAMDIAASLCRAAALQAGCVAVTFIYCVQTHGTMVETAK